MKYGSVCSGVEAASLAWEPLGWQPQWFSEIDKFPSAVLQHHWPDVANLGDMTSDHFRNNTTAIDLLVGGTPCQSFSVAGLRGGLDDERGNLALEFCRLVDRLTPRWFVWENVSGVLSSNGGRDFGSIVGAMAELGYNLAWRILDAQHFGVPQRRRRIFLVGHLGADERGATAVLFESQSLQGHTAPSREERQDLAHVVTSGPLFCVNARQTPVSMSDKACTLGAKDRGRAVYPINTMAALRDQGADQNRQTFGIGADGDPVPTLSKAHSHAIATGMQVRRLTPRECERLQGMPDDHTRIPWRGKLLEDCPDTPRYKAIGNSMAVPVMRWIGERIQMVDNILNRGGSNDGQHI
jgi:DNA (cytosine-5)-methyltransferase 1